LGGYGGERGGKALKKGSERSSSAIDPAEAFSGAGSAKKVSERKDERGVRGGKLGQKGEASRFSPEGVPRCQGKARGERSPRGGSKKSRTEKGTQSF